MEQTREDLTPVRRSFSHLGWAMLIYNALMSIVVMAFVFIDALQAELMGTAVDSSGWGYLLAIAIGVILLLLWKKPGYFRTMFTHRGKPMKLGRFLALVMVCLGAQVISQLAVLLLELVLSQFGLSVLEYLETLDTGDTLAMFLYVSLGAPIAEELLFRGLVCGTMVPYGKKFAILTSAFLFGLFHGNLIQIPFAFAVGLVLGYVAVEYNLFWAMALHMFNNLIYADTFPRLLRVWTPRWENLLGWCVLILAGLASLVILLVKLTPIVAYLRRNPNRKGTLRAFWTAPGILVMVILMTLSTLATVFLMVV